MTAAPTISVFRTSRGSPVARGVLVTGTRVRPEDAGEFSADPFKAGLLSPWPETRLVAVAADRYFSLLCRFLLRD